MLEKIVTRIYKNYYYEDNALEEWFSSNIAIVCRTLSSILRPLNSRWGQQSWSSTSELQIFPAKNEAIRDDSVVTYRCESECVGLCHQAPDLGYSIQGGVTVLVYNFVFKKSVFFIAVL